MHGSNEPDLTNFGFLRLTLDKILKACNIGANEEVGHSIFIQHRHGYM